MREIESLPATSHSLKEHVLAFAAILVGIYLLSPRGWEMLSDGLKQWFAARLLVERFEFPTFSHGPLYTLFVQCFRLFEYPNSVLFEYWATHIVCYVPIYLLLRQVWRFWPSLLLTIAWIPFLGDVSGYNGIFGMGFFALYLIRIFDPERKREWFPLPLVIAALSHSLFTPFMIGHVIGMAGIRWFSREPLNGSRDDRPKVDLKSSWNRTSMLFKLALAVLVLLTIFFPPKHRAYNHFATDATYAPVQLKGITSAYFMIATHREMERRTPDKDELNRQDWYFTKHEVFGDAQSILSSAINSPMVFLANLVGNIPGMVEFPRKFITGYWYSQARIWKAGLDQIYLLPAWVVVLLGMMQFSFLCLRNGMGEYLVASAFGSASTIAVLFLTWFNFRYQIIILPLALLFIILAPSGLMNIWNGWKVSRSSVRGNGQDGMDKMRSLWIRRVGGIFLSLAGISTFPIWFILSKVLTGDFQSTQFDLLTGMKASHFMVVSCVFTLALFFLGMVCLTRGNQVLLFMSSCVTAQPIAHHRWWTTAYASILIGALVLTSPRPLGEPFFPPSYQWTLSDWLKGKYFLQGYDRSMLASYPKLMEGLDRKNARILLSNDATWAYGVIGLNLDTVYDYYSLPPFEDDTGRVERFLSDLDEIWVREDLPVPNVGYQFNEYLRYALHVKPFLEQNVGHGWIRKEIPSYGFRYIRHKTRVGF